MMRPALVDVNVLLPLLLPQHPAHAAARQWLGLQAKNTTRYALPVQLGVLRLLSQPRVMGNSALLPEVALQTWADLVDAADMQELVAPQPQHALLLRQCVAGRVATPNLWTNAWLAALAMATNSTMVTFDHGFRGFTGLQLTLLQAP